MQIKQLTLTNVRAFSHAEITFQPGMNLIVGINGVGKSTILDTLRILLSHILPTLSQSRNKRLSFEASDITVNQNALTAELTFEISRTEFRYLVHQSRFLFTPTANHTGEVRDQTYINVVNRNLTPPAKEIPKSFKTAPEQSLALYFSPRRALANSGKSTSKAKGLAAAFTDALAHRELRLMEFADWWLAQTALAAENAPNAQRHLDALNAAITHMIDSCANIRANRETFSYQDKNGKLTQKATTTLLIEKAEKTFDLGQLSDGERGILALTLDLARRLSQANPHLEDPLKAAAVVLIDELDLHLHPQWQRTIVSKLTATFPNCQFIATTHSPLIIGEVQPSGLILLQQENNRTQVIQSGLQGFGLDSSWILRHLMETDSRNPETKSQIDRVEEALEEGNLDLARQNLDQLKTMLHGSDDEVIRLEASINNLEALADAVDTEAE